MKALYIIFLIPLIHMLVFDYLPMYGVLISFKNFKYADGILGSKWNNFKHYKDLFGDILFKRVFWNTLRLSVLRIACFPLPIIFALLLNEITKMKFKRVVQTISYLPHFLSWVVIAGFVYQLLSPEVGIINYLRTLFGKEPVYFMIKSSYFIPIYLVTTFWAGVGWGSIVYLASISAIDINMYESAVLDGANRFQKAIHITLPSITPTITILFILSLRNILKASFDPIFNLYNPLIYDVADVIETYTFRKGLFEAKYDYAAAVGLFQNVVGLLLILITNSIIKKINDYGIW
ncbi:MAG: sugar ABC transporter permease [Firmicutes bacterium]|nr:sugar ABC transporter permease [Bacillota bacterium]